MLVTFTAQTRSTECTESQRRDHELNISHRASLLTLHVQMLVRYMALRIHNSATWGHSIQLRYCHLVSSLRNSWQVASNACDGNRRLLCQPLPLIYS